ncbi:HlyD family type I secretion periplasmic adaptor subunit [Variovorax sp. J22P271]|uniref:HlyD family type I secretion periplasmic adaptor subunit n=1 Tax=Variovorax davisae TaxID=3053515 RepID=UPI002578E128|nr:HlyD family type I secretion periplasmic adaptor subunit [Variovorax sp. J22P271]MDM0037066.1 HlyD family type I secretion periplasmic adaptor subunit [Variovorax sp. J22P271]
MNEANTVALATPTPPATPAARGPSGRARAEDLAFVQDLREAMLVQKTPGSLLVLYLIATILVVTVVWAHLARVEEITHGEGRVIPASREQIIQSLEGGILETMNVAEGDIVEKGQVLLEIDPTRAGASYREGLSKVLALKASIARLRAEAYQTPLDFPADVKAVPSIVRDETQAFNARRQTLNESVQALQRSLQLAEKEISLSEPLSARGLMSEVEILRMKRQANDFRLQIAERQNKFRADANAELTRYEGELAQSKENVGAREDVMNRTTVRAPVRGTVKNIRVTTIGGVIQQGADIMEIVPLEDQLLVEAKIKPSDVAFVRPGLPATVKISAYDYAIYGGLKGTVEHLSPDTLKDDEKARAGRADATYYRLLVRTDRAALSAGGKEFPIIPGMTATAEIRTGEKTILSYLLKPVLKAREAFRER